MLENVEGDKYNLNPVDWCKAYLILIKEILKKIHFGVQHWLDIFIQIAYYLRYSLDHISTKSI